MKYSFPKRMRLRRARDFARVRRKGTVVRFQALTISAVVGGTEQRLGIIVTRRIGNAVQRNRLKRLVREFYRQRRELFPQGSCVVIPRLGAAELDPRAFRHQLSRALEHLLKKLSDATRGHPT